MPRYFIIMGHENPTAKFDHVEEHHGNVVGAVLFNSPCGRLVYGATEFIPHQLEETDKEPRP